MSTFSKTKSGLSQAPGQRRNSSTSESSASSGDAFEQVQNKKYRLKVTAGSGYDVATHQSVPVNGDQTVRIDSELATVSLGVRVRDYNGYPDNSPPMHPIFSHPQHTTDQYALTFSIFFKKAPVNGNDLIFGNDFDRSLRDRLPPGINTAIRLVKWSIDPSMDGDVYADKPYLFSPALASWNQFRIGDKVRKGVEEVPKVGDVVVEEGADGDEGWGIREEHGIPGDNRNNDKGNGSARMKHFQNEEARKKFVFEEGRKYWVNFGNPYLCFNDFSLHLPGFTLHAIKYVDEKNHDLRYVLKNRKTGEVYFVVLFTLVLLGTDEEPGHKEQIEQDTQTTKDKSEQLGKYSDVD